MKLKATKNQPFDAYRCRKMINGKCYAGYGKTPDEAIQNFLEKYKDEFKKKYQLEDFVAFCRREIPDVMDKLWEAFMSERE